MLLVEQPLRSNPWAIEKGAPLSEDRCAGSRSLQRCASSVPARPFLRALPSSTCGCLEGSRCSRHRLSWRCKCSKKTAPANCVLTPHSSCCCHLFSAACRRLSTPVSDEFKARPDPGRPPGPSPRFYGSLSLVKTGQGQDAHAALCSVSTPEMPGNECCGLSCAVARLEFELLCGLGTDGPEAPQQAPRPVRPGGHRRERVTSPLMPPGLVFGHHIDAHNRHKAEWPFHHGSSSLIGS